MDGSRSALRDLLASTEDLSGLIRLSDRCIKQYQTQFTPGLTLAQVRTQLYERIITAGVFATEQPRAITSANHGTVGWLVVDDDIVLPVREDGTETRPLVAVNVLYRPQ